MGENNSNEVYIPISEQKCRNVVSEQDRKCSECFWCAFTGEKYICTIDMCYSDIVSRMEAFWGQKNADA